MAKEELNELFRTMHLCPGTQKAIAIRENIILDNLGLAHYIVKKRWKANSLTEEDLTQEAIIGLILAVDKFDPDNESSFATYAVYWIEHTVRRAIENKDLLIRIPTYKRLENKLLAKEPVLRSDAIYDPDDTGFWMPKSRFESEDITIGNVSTSSIPEFLSNLNDTERFIITRYTGYDDDLPISFNQISNELGLIKEEVVEIYHGIVTKLTGTVSLAQTREQLVARILELVALGWNNSAIGRELGIPRTTVALWKKQATLLVHQPPS